LNATSLHHLAEVCKTPDGKMPLQTCPICGVNEETMELVYKHTAHHLRELPLLALPTEFWSDNPDYEYQAARERLHKGDVPEEARLRGSAGL